MKNSIITLAFVMFFVSSEAMGLGTEPDSSLCLELDGIILNAGQGQHACRVELLCMNVLTDSARLTPGKNNFNFLLKKDKYYTLRFTMADHINKVICIDTKNAEIPPDEKELFYFSFETSLIDKSKAGNINMDVTELPVAILFYDAQNEQFSYSKEYSNQIKKEMYLTSK